MKLILTAILHICLLLSCFAQSPTQVRFELKRLRLENTYRWVGDFDSVTGIATVYNNGQMGYIDTNGKMVLPLGNYTTKDFDNGIGLYSYGKTNKAVNKQGKVVKEFTNIEFASGFKEGKALFRGFVKGRQLYGILNFAGDTAIPCQYSYIEEISKHYYMVWDWDKGYGVINKKGDTVIPLQYQFNYIDTSDLSFIGYQKDIGFAIFDSAGKVKKFLGKKVYTDDSYVEGNHYYQRDGVIIVKNKFSDPNTKYALVNLSFDTIVPLGRYFHLSSVNEGLILFADSIHTERLDSRVSVSEYVHCGFLNTKGEMVIPALFDAATYFTEGLCAVRRNGKYGYINKKGEQVIPLQYDYALPFRYGYAKVQVQDKFYIIDKNGNIVMNSKSYR